MEVTNIFKGLDLIDRVPEELWTEVRDIVLEAMIKTIPKKKKCKKAKWLSEEALQIAEKRKEAKGKGERYTHLNAEFQRIARRDKDCSAINAKKYRKKIEWERLEMSSRKLEILREHFQRRKWQPTPGFLPGESQGWRSLVGCCLWGCTELNTTEGT